MSPEEEKSISGGSSFMESIIVACITSVVTLIGVILSNSKSRAVMGGQARRSHGEGREAQPGPGAHLPTRTGHGCRGARHRVLEGKGGLTWRSSWQATGGNGAWRARSRRASWAWRSRTSTSLSCIVFSDTDRRYFRESTSTSTVSTMLAADDPRSEWKIALPAT